MAPLFVGLECLTFLMMQRAGLGPESYNSIATMRARISFKAFTRILCQDFVLYHTSHLKSFTMKFITSLVLLAAAYVSAKPSGTAECAAIYQRCIETITVREAFQVLVRS